MFANVGGEIKNRAVRYVVWRTLLWAVLTLLPVVLIWLYTVETTVFLIFIIVWLISLLIAYFHFRDKAMLLYAQGELTENVMIIKNILSARPQDTRKTNSIIINPNPSGTSSISENDWGQRNYQMEGDFWRCTGCGTDNVNTARYCHKCGTPKPY